MRARRIILIGLMFGAVAAAGLLWGGGISPSQAGANDSALKVEPGVQPASTLVPQNAKAVSFTAFKITALGSKDIRVNGILIENKSVASDGIFSEVGVSGSPIYLEEFPLNGNHQRKTKKSFVVKAGETMELEIYGNMVADLSAYDGQRPALTLAGIDADAKVQGTLPITGAVHTVNATLAIGSIAVSQGSLDPRVSQTFLAGAKDRVFTSVRADVGSQEGVTLTSATWTQFGSMGLSDLENVRTYVTYNGVTTSFPAEVDTGDTRKYWASDFGDGIVLPKGGFAEITLKGDIKSGVGRTIRFDLEAGWLEGTGQTYGYTIQSADTITGSNHTIGSGSINIAAANVSEYQSESQLGMITIMVRGEAMEVRAFELQLLSSGITSVKLWDDAGKLAAGPVDPSPSGRVRFTTIWTAPIGKATYHITAASPGSFKNSFAISAKGTATRQDIIAGDLAP